jgi:DNA repair protein RecO (recombination protein O)
MSEMIHTRGIVLHKFRYAENSLIVKVYTEQLGLQSYLIKGVSGKKAGGKAGASGAPGLAGIVAYHRRGITYNMSRRCLSPIPIVLSHI